MSFARICKEKNVKLYSLVSAVNADAKSFFLYSQVKGEVGVPACVRVLPTHGFVLR